MSNVGITFRLHHNYYFAGHVRVRAGIERYAEGLQAWAVVHCFFGSRNLA